MHRTLTSLAFVLVACSSVNDGPTDGDSGTHKPPACTSTTQPKVLVADFGKDLRRGEPSMVGDDVFWVDDSQGPDAIFPRRPASSCTCR